MEEHNFIEGDIIVNKDFSIIGIFSEECQSIDREGAWPMFKYAFVNGTCIQNYDDMLGDWPFDYREATNDEEELFLMDLEEATKKVWDYGSMDLVERDDSGWKIDGNCYPSSWEKALKENEDADEYTNSYLICDSTNAITSRISKLGKLIILRDMYMKGYTLETGETAYAIIKITDNAFTVRPYIYGTRNSIMSFRFQSQAREFLTYFEDMIKESYELMY